MVSNLGDCNYLVLWLIPFIGEPTMVTNHLLNGMIIQVVPCGLDVVVPAGDSAVESGWLAGDVGSHLSRLRVVNDRWR